MKHYDVIVIGSGSGLDVANAAVQKKLRVALIEEGPLGGTCLNRGCIPSKMVLHAADVAEEVRNASRFGISASIKKIDFASITNYASGVVDKDAREIESALRSHSGIDLYKKHAEFVSERIILAGKEKIKGDKIIIAAGTRTLVPAIPGLNEAGYITSDQALRLRKQPKSIAIIGGGYISAEMAHFFGALGTEVTIIERNPLLMKLEDEDVAKAFTAAYQEKHNVFLNSTTDKVRKRGKRKVVSITTPKGKKNIVAEEVLVAVGRQSNADVLHVERAGIEVNERGYIKANEYLETNVHNIWAFGDIIGKYMFKHAANHEAGYVIANAFNMKRVAVDYRAMPHAAFSSPQVAGVGYTEQELKAKGISYKVARYDYSHTGMGAAFKETKGFVKALASPEDTILGFHAFGPLASTLVAEVTVAMKQSGKVSAITDAIHVHPALNEIVQRAFWQTESQ